MCSKVNRNGDRGPRPLGVPLHAAVVAEQGLELAEGMRGRERSYPEKLVGEGRTRVRKVARESVLGSVLRFVLLFVPGQDGCFDSHEGLGVHLSALGFSE